MHTEIRQTRDRRAFPVQPFWVVGSLLVAYLGIWAHEFHRVPASWGFTLEGLLSLVLPAAVIFWAWWRFPWYAAPLVALWALGLIHLLGACVTVLPLAFLPFVPEQTVSHYLAHAIYAAGQLPLLLVALRLSQHSAAGKRS